MIRRNTYDPAERYYAEREEARQMAEKDNQTPELSPEQIRAVIDAETKSMEQRLEEKSNGETVVAWMTQTPTYKPSAQASAQIKEFIEARGLPVTIESLDSAFNYLSEKGLIETNPAAPIDSQVVKLARKSYLQSRAEGLASQVQRHTTEDMYDMPLEKLRELAFNGGRNV